MATRMTRKVRVTGNLDALRSELLSYQLLALIGGTSDDVAVDLSDVPSVDPCGVSVLMVASSLLQSERRELVVEGSEPVRAAMRSLGALL